jgi:hypothetical protein
MRAAVLVGFFLRVGCAFGQVLSATQDAPLWLIEAQEAECVSPEEIAVLADMGQVNGVTQQRILLQLGEERGREVLPCLMDLASFQALLKMGMKSGSPREKTWGSIRLDGVLSSPNCAVFSARAHFQHWGLRGGHWRVRLDGAASAGFGHCMSRVWVRERGRLAAGALAPRFGQGLVLWVSSAFDDLGGMEGSHRVPLGLVPAASRLRGVIDGVGWQRHLGLRSKGGFAPNWWVMGRISEGRGWTGAMGGGGATLQWAIRAVPESDCSWRGVIGLNGRGQLSGWNWRWAMAGFASGWTFRASVLRSWTPAFEWHALLARDHPEHPAWHSGEWKATVPDEADGVGWLFQSGVAWNENGSGWLRWRCRKGMKPSDFPEHRWAMRWQNGAFRATTQLDMSKAWQEELRSVWTVRLRWSFQDGGWPSARWRLHAVAAGEAEAKGGVVAMSWFYRGVKGTRWSFGVGQAWGHENAPLRYVTAWNERPAQPFGRRNGHAFFRYQSRTGQWRIRGKLEMAEQETHEQGSALTLQGFGVEFRLD